MGLVRPKEFANKKQGGGRNFSVYLLTSQYSSLKFITMQNHQIIRDCLEQFDKGALTREQLSEAFDQVLSGKRQDLLYAQAVETGLDSRWIGMSMMIDGELMEPDDDDWPYSSTIDAIKDGWRVISFPNTSLSLNENRTYGLGFEFILEKWR